MDPDHHGEEESFPFQPLGGCRERRPTPFLVIARIPDGPQD
jgi:hypothetical protein